MKNFFASKLVFIFIFIANAFSIHAIAQCDSEIQAAIQKKMSDFNTIYNSIDSRRGKIRKDNGSLFLSGTNGKAVIVQHGFVASPFEVLSIANKLNQQGYTVYAPLLIGFGASARVANSISKLDWMNDFSENVQLMKRCYEKVSLVGFSIGATLSLNYAYQHPKDINSLVLVSPFYDVNLRILEFVDRYVNLFTNEVPIESLYELTLNQDLVAILNHPQFYTQDFPLVSAIEVIELGKHIRKQFLYSKNSKNIAAKGIPNFTVYSKADMTVSQPLVSKLPRALFSKPVVKMIPLANLVPHQVLLPKYNPKIDAVLEGITGFVKAND